MKDQKEVENAEATEQEPSRSTAVMCSDGTEYKVGDYFYMHRDKRKYHIIAIIDNPKKSTESENMIVVYTYFGIHKKWWHTGVKDESDFKLYHKYKMIRKTRAVIGT